jgi:hypothetical protein
MTECVHIAGNSQQPLAAFIDAEGQEIFACAVCSAEKVCTMLLTMSPERVANAVMFNRCGHHRNDELCRVCYVGVSSYLTLMWSMLRFNDKHLANRIGRLIGEWTRLHGPSSYLGAISNRQFDPSQ